MGPGDIVGLLAGVYVHIIDSPDTTSPTKSVIITCRMDRATQKKLVATDRFDHAWL
jgi:hypothetical protein